SRSTSSPPWGSINASPRAGRDRPTRISLLAVGRVQAALDLFLACPASRTGVLTRHHGPRAVRAADRRVVAVVKRVVGDVVLVDKGPDPLQRPVRERVRLHHAELRVPLDLLGVRPGRRLVAAHAGDPGVHLAERARERLDLADRAALVGSALPELVAMEASLLFEGEV